MENNIEKNNEIEEVAVEAEEQSEVAAEEGKKSNLKPIVIICTIVAIVAVIAVVVLLLANNNPSDDDSETPSTESGDPVEEDNTIDYTVTVYDDLNNPISNVIIKFTDLDGNTKIKKTGTDGVASLDDVTCTEYQITVDTATSKVTVTETEYTLTKENNSLTIYARNTNDTVEITGDVEEGTYAHTVTTGDFSVHTKTDETTFLYFKPVEAGIYHFTITSSVSDSSVGYYGLPDDVQLINIGDYDEDTQTLTIVMTHTEVAYVIGVESETSENVQISVKRVGNAPYYIYGAVEDGTTAENIGTGTYSLTGKAGKTSYAVFNPGISGVYRVSFVSDDIGMTVGYYGIPMFVQSTHRGEGEYDGKTFELIIQDGATPYVLGLNFTIDCTAALTVERISDAPFDPQFAPWTDVPASFDIVDCNIPAGGVITDIDITDPTLTVTLGDDGYYYTNDGKLVYIRINSLGNNRYLDTTIASIYGLTNTNSMGGVGGLNFGGYVYDENGEFVGKYTFNNMLGSYYDSCSPEGICPLTAELAEAFKINGNATGWWKFGSANYLFGSAPIVVENAWLFLCCTVE